jgi:hypothetical protein
MGGKKKKKEEEKRKGKKPDTIDVDALLKSGTKKSVTTKTMDAMTSLEKTAILGSTEKTLLKQAKKGLRQEAMKVCCPIIVVQFGFPNLTNNYFFTRQNIASWSSKHSWPILQALGFLSVIWSIDLWK